VLDKRRDHELVPCGQVSSTRFPPPRHGESFADLCRERNGPRLGEPRILTGVARGDVERIVLLGGVDGRQTIYTRSKTWGEFDSAQATSSTARLLVYGHGLLLETVRLDVPVGQQRVLR
jgi:hypothetical protein